MINTVVRDYLINWAKRKAPVSYSQIAKDCGLGLNLKSAGDRKKLSNILGEISAFELENGRPMISAVAMYQDLDDHGGGFYALCEELGIGSKKELRQQEYAVIQMIASFDYWSKSREEFFTIEELEFFKTWGYHLYDPNNAEHFNIKNRLMETVWEKTGIWAKNVVNALTGYEAETHKYWSQRGYDKEEKRRSTRIKHYTWAKIFKKGKKDADIFFSIGLGAYAKSFEIRIDYQRNRDPKLNQYQQKVCEQFLAENIIKPVIIPFTTELNWDILNHAAIDFIKNNEQKFEELLQLVWPNLATEYAPRKEIDYETRSRNARLLGSIGEDIVLKLERGKVAKTHPAKTKLVNQVADHHGFDIASFDANGNPIMIEVKTTTMDSSEPFFMSSNQKTVSEKTPDKYFIYRIHDIDISVEPPLYQLKIVSCAGGNLSFEPVSFQVKLI